MRTLDGHSNCVNSVSISKDELKIASGSSDKTLKIWEASSGILLKSLENGKRVWSVCFSPNGSYIAIVDNKRIRLCDVSTGNLLLKFEGHSEIVNLLFS